MAFTATLAKFARSPQGRRVFREATRLAKDPASRTRIAEARRSLEGKSARGEKPAQ